MAEEIKMAENVMLIDASFLNLVIKDIKRHFEKVLGRTLEPINVADLCAYLACDAGIHDGDNQIQVLFIYDKESAELAFCRPSGLEKELTNVAFKDNLGEFSFFTFQPGDLATLDELYLESLKVITHAEEVKKLIVVSYNENYGERADAILEESAGTGKEIVQFRMDEPLRKICVHWEILAYPVMQAFGIRGDEL